MARTYRKRPIAAAIGLLSLCACGDGDVTILDGPSTEDQPLQPTSAEGSSRAIAALTTPEGLDTVCRIIGVSSVSGAAEGAGARDMCSQVVDDCRGGVQAVFGAGPAGAPALPPVSLEPLLGCALTLPELDACLGAVLERGIETYGSAIGCDMPALPEVDPIRLFTSGDCLVALLKCPELLTSFTPPITPPR